MNNPQSRQAASRITSLTGAYFWFPRRNANALQWELITCHDFEVSDGISHRKFWPLVLEHLAAAWGRDEEALKRRLSDHYSGLPRGRITHPKSGYLIVHGDDAPVRGWLSVVKRRFWLNRVKPEFDDHERMIREDYKAVEDALGILLGLDRFV